MAEMTYEAATAKWTTAVGQATRGAGFPIDSAYLLNLTTQEVRDAKSIGPMDIFKTMTDWVAKAGVEAKTARTGHSRASSSARSSLSSMPTRTALSPYSLHPGKQEGDDDGKRGGGSIGSKQVALLQDAFLATLSASSTPSPTPPDMSALVLRTLTGQRGEGKQLLTFDSLSSAAALPPPADASALVLRTPTSQRTAAFGSLSSTPRSATRVRPNVTIADGNVEDDDKRAARRQQRRIVAPAAPTPTLFAPRSAATKATARTLVTPSAARTGRLPLVPTFSGRSTAPDLSSSSPRLALPAPSSLFRMPAPIPVVATPPRSNVADPRLVATAAAAAATPAVLPRTVIVPLGGERIPERGGDDDAPTLVLEDIEMGAIKGRVQYSQRLGSTEDNSWWMSRPPGKRSYQMHRFVKAGLERKDAAIVVPEYIKTQSSIDARERGFLVAIAQHSAIQNLHASLTRYDAMASFTRDHLCRDDSRLLLAYNLYYLPDDVSSRQPDMHTTLSLLASGVLIDKSEFQETAIRALACIKTGRGSDDDDDDTAIKSAAVISRNLTRHAAEYLNTHSIIRGMVRGSGGDDAVIAVYHMACIYNLAAIMLNLIFTACGSRMLRDLKVLIEEHTYWFVETASGQLTAKDIVWLSTYLRVGPILRETNESPYLPLLAAIMLQRSDLTDRILELLDTSETGGLRVTRNQAAHRGDGNMISTLIEVAAEQPDSIPLQSAAAWLFADVYAESAMEQDGLRYII